MFSRTSHNRTPIEIQNLMFDLAKSNNDLKLFMGYMQNFRKGDIVIAHLFIVVCYLLFMQIKSLDILSISSFKLEFNQWFKTRNSAGFCFIYLYQSG